MSDRWYCLAFGIELGPMSRDDLRMLASRGELLLDSQVRQGPSGAWVAARTIADLFPSSSGSAAESRWYYEFLGEVLGPMSFEDLQLLAQGGALRPESRVREGTRGEWKAASTMVDLFHAVEGAAAEGEADFEVSASHFASRPAVPNPADVAPVGSSPAADVDDADFDLGPPAAAS